MVDRTLGVDRSHKGVGYIFRRSQQITVIIRVVGLMFVLKGTIS